MGRVWFVTGWALISLLLVLCLLLCKRIFALYKHREREGGSLDSDRIIEGVTLLRNRGHHGAVAIFTEPMSGLFVRFRKYIGRRIASD